MKVVIIGCTHAGTAAATHIRQHHPEAKITVYEENDNISFLSCGIALYIEGVVKEVNGLFYNSPQALAEENIDVYMQHTVSSIDMEKKTLSIHNKITGKVFEDQYDKLIITTGSVPVQPKIENADLENIVLCKNYNDAQALFAKMPTLKRVVVVGAGYIGVELGEAFRENGLEITLIDLEDRILAKYLDPEFTDICESSLKIKGIRLALGESVTHFEGREGKVTQVITNKGAYDADLVVLCIGFKPNTVLFGDQLEKLPNGAIKIDEYLQCSRSDVFAAGDCCSVIYNPTKTQEYIPLATNAVRMGTLIAQNLLAPTRKYLGTQGTSGVKIYENCVGSTGLTELSAKGRGLSAASACIRLPYRPAFMPRAEEVLLKIVYDDQTHRILGGQLLSTIDLTAAINTLSVCIQKEMTVDELAFVDFFFQPHFNNPWNYLNAVALEAIGISSAE